MKPITLVLPDTKACLFTPIDVQREFCDPAYGERGNERTAAVSKRIASIAPEFNKLGMDTCWVYYDRYLEADPFERAFGGPYAVKPSLTDLFANKNTDSAFETKASPFQALLKQKRKTTLLVAGFNLTACVKRTVHSALQEGYTVILLHDLCENDNANTASPKKFDMFKRQTGELIKERKANKRPVAPCYYATSDKVLDVLRRRQRVARA